MIDIKICRLIYCRNLFHVQFLRLDSDPLVTIVVHLLENLFVLESMGSLFLLVAPLNDIILLVKT